MIDSTNALGRLGSWLYWKTKILPSLVVILLVVLTFFLAPIQKAEARIVIDTSSSISVDALIESLTYEASHRHLGKRILEPTPIKDLETPKQLVKATTPAMTTATIDRAPNRIESTRTRAILHGAKSVLVPATAKKPCGCRTHNTTELSYAFMLREDQKPKPHSILISDNLKAPTQSILNSDIQPAPTQSMLLAGNQTQLEIGSDSGLSFASFRGQVGEQGKCCFPNGDSICPVFPEECELQGGIAFFPTTNCFSAPPCPPPPTGACCNIFNVPEFCIDFSPFNTQVQCEANLGQFFPGILCSQVNCLNGTVCGNGILEKTDEECDDGNTTNGDGCSATCQLEFCGNGVLDPGEECDDGNNNDGDGCSANCTIEAPPVICEDIPLFTFRGQHVGNITVELIRNKRLGNGDEWLVTYSTEVREGSGTSDWLIRATNLHVACDVSQIPQTRRGNARIFAFEHRAEHSPTSTVQFTVPAPDCSPGDGEGDCSCGTVFAAHAVIVPAQGGRSQAAWADGCDFPGPNFGTYFNCDCGL